MRISDWSSDVCSSDLPEPDIETAAPPAWKRRRVPPFLAVGPVLWLALAPWLALERTSLAGPRGCRGQAAGRPARLWLSDRAEERRDGNQCVSSCSYRRSPSH